MVKNCNGIPLAIVVLGGILRKKEGLEGWRLVSENISSYLRRGNDHGKSCMEVLALSYTDLPYHLKPCFLHLANFPEDYEIHAEKLYRMWAAEGLIAWPYDRLSNTETLEDIADEYLDLLAQAGMVQIVNKASNGRIKSVRIHDLMRDVCLQRAATENFFTTIDHRACPDEPQSLSSSMNHARLLHMAIYLSVDVNNYLPDFLTSKAHKRLKSLLLFWGQEIRAGGQVPNWMKSICNDFPWLRVLDVEGLRLKGRLTKDVQNMKHLRYLSLKGTDVSDVPSSIGNLMFLQTLDLRVSFPGSPVKIPNTLWKLERLRHLFLPKKPYQIKKSKFLCLHTLTCLEVLKNLEVGMLKAEDLLKIRKLKKLSMKGFAEKVESIRNIVNSPAAKAGHLRSCSLCVKGAVLDAHPRILSRFDCLHLLKVRDKLSCFKENVLPQSVAELHMESCQLEKDPMEILGSLNHLRHLSLDNNSFVGKKMASKANSFPQLLKLNLQGLTNLEEWTVAEKSMIKLNKLIIMSCSRLKRIPVTLPRTVQVTCSPCIQGIEKIGTCNYHGATSIGRYHGYIVCRRHDIEAVEKLLLSDEYNKVVLLGPAGVGKSAVAKSLFRQSTIWEKFNTITCIRLPHRLNIEDMMQPKCLLILTGSATPSSRDVDKILGARIPEESKILLTINALSLHEISTKQHKNVHPWILPELDEIACIWLLRFIVEFFGLSRKLPPQDHALSVAQEAIRRCSGQALSVILLAGVFGTKESLIEWENFRDKVIKVADDSLPEGLYALCYEDLPHYLQDCFVYLAMFPENSEISARKLQHMWVAAGFVSFKDDGKSRKKNKEGTGEVEKLLENVAASYLNELVARRMVEVEKTGLDARISTCRLHNSLRSLCLQKAEEKGFMRAEVKSSNERGSTGRSDKRWLNLPRQCLCLGEQRQEQLEEQREDQLEEQREEHVPTMSALRLNEIEHLAVCVGQSEREILDHPESVSDQLRSLLFFPEASGTIKRGFSWQCFKTICNRFTHLLVLDLEGMQMMTGTLPEDVGNLRNLKYLSLRGTGVTSLPLTIQQLGHLQTLDLRVIASLTIPGDSFRFHQLRLLYLPESFSVTPSPKLQSMTTSSKLSLSGSDNLQILANLQTNKVDLNCVPDLKILSRVSVNHIHAKDELDDILKFRGTAIELIIKSEIFNSDILLSSFQNLSNMTIKGMITAPLSESMFPKGLKELKLKHTKLADDPNPFLRHLPELTHLTFDHDSFLGKRMVISSGFVRLSHLTLRLLDNLEELDMTEAVHLGHVEPVTIECWRVELKYPTSDAGSEIPFDEMMTVTTLDQVGMDTNRETDVETSKPIGDPNSESPSASYTIHAAEITEEEEAVEQMSSGMHTNRETHVGPSKLIGNRDFESGDNVPATEITEEEGAIEDVHATEITEEEGAIADTHVAEITEEEEGNEQM